MRNLTLHHAPRGLMWLAALLMLGCYSSPTGRRQLLVVPEGQMRQLGNQAFAQMVDEGKLSGDAALTRRVKDIGLRVAQESGLDEKWNIKLFASDEINAFALPGGNIGVYEGILDVARTNAGLAAILAHEVAHVAARHSGERVSQSIVADLGLTAIDGLLLSGSKYRDLTMAALGVGTQVGVMLPFSRTHESEADRIGLTYMARAGYDPEEAVKLWERMAKLGDRGPEFLSTHPDPLNRAKRLRKLLPEARRIYQKSKKQPTKVLRGEDGEPVAKQR